MKVVTAAICGGVFAVGLVIAGMTSPARIIAFLDVGGAWDPTLAFVMAGAIGVYAPVARIVRGRPHPLFARRFHWPERGTIDARLVVGSAIFGVGWGLSGYCPGPALVAAGTGNRDTLLFVGSVIVGIALTRLVLRRKLANEA